MNKAAKVLFLFIILILFPFLRLRAAENDEPLLVPTSGWLVGSASVLPAGTGDKKEGGLPCVMVNQFDNGFTLRISGGGGAIYALAIDFRQPAFRLGESYRIGIGVPPSFNKTLEGVAHNPATLIVSTRDAEGFYQALRGGQALTIDMGGRAMQFALVGAAEGLDRIESCFAPGSSFPQESVSPPREAYRMKSGNPEQSGMEKISAPGAEELLPLDGLPPNEQASALNTISPAAGMTEGATSPGANADQPPPGKTVTTSHRLAKTWASPENARAKNSKQAQPAAQTGQKKTPIPQAGMERRWRVIKGASLREVLDVWTTQENAELVWMPQDDFVVPESFGIQGTFESALSTLLEQYGNEETRPLGKIYVEPGTGGKVLLIEAGGSY